MTKLNFLLFCRRSLETQHLARRALSYSSFNFVFNPVVLTTTNKLVVGIFVYMTFIVAVHGQINASRCLHNGLLKGVFRCPMAFFDSTPIGRIINRFAKDIDVIDHEMSVHLLDFLEQVFESLGILFAVSFASPTFLAAVPFLLILYFFIQVHKTYCSTSLVAYGMCLPCLHLVLLYGAQ